jgi:hypothetical protein
MLKVVRDGTFAGTSGEIAQLMRRRKVTGFTFTAQDNTLPLGRTRNQ